MIVALIRIEKAGLGQMDGPERVNPTDEKQVGPGKALIFGCGRRIINFWLLLYNSSFADRFFGEVWDEDTDRYVHTAL